MHTEFEWKAFDAQASAARERPARIERMAYRAPGTMSVPAQAEVRDAVPEAAPPEDFRAEIAGLRTALAEAARTASAQLEEVRQESRHGAEQLRLQTQQRERETLDAAAGQLRTALESFRVEREDYFAKVEREVVRLALGIAARILNREAMLDPLLLTGAVRVALGQLGETTGVRLRCPVDQVERWREVVGQLSDRSLAPEIDADPRMAAGECVLETLVGTVDLGVRAQLEEIERGFFDLLEQRPGAAMAHRSETSPAK